MIVTLALLVLIADDPEDPGAQVLAFARTKVGEKVGNGECATLAVEALKEAGIRVRFRDGAVKWGEPRAKVEDAQPGDILQFEDVTFFKKTKRPGGAIATMSYNFPHHTAIVSEARKVKGAVVLKILHQNVGLVDEAESKRKRVCEWTLSLADLQGGSLVAYRPVVE